MNVLLCTESRFFRLRFSRDTGKVLLAFASVSSSPGSTFLLSSYD